MRPGQERSDEFPIANCITRKEQIMGTMVLLGTILALAATWRLGALSANRELNRFVDPELRSWPVYQYVHIYKGAMLGLASGYARPLVAGDQFCGIAYEEIDNTAGASGARNVRSFMDCEFEHTLTSVAITDAGKTVFASADDTITLTAGANSPVGTIRQYMSANTALIRFTPGLLVVGAPINFGLVTPGAETTGTLITTGTKWPSFTAVGGCAIKVMVENATASGDFTNLRLRARSAGLGATECVNASASAVINDYGNLFGLKGSAQPGAYTQAGAGTFTAGVYSCLDGAGTSSGRKCSMWIDDHSTTAKATAGHHLLYMTQNALGGTPVNIDGAIAIQASRLPFLFDILTADGFLTDTSRSLDNQAGAIAVRTPAGTRYIALYDH